MPAIRKDVDIDALRMALSYEPETGIFRRIDGGQGRGQGHRPVGSIGGSQSPNGYRVIEIRGRAYPAHRVAWMLTYNEVPGELDHINGDRGDNRIRNLRRATRSQNLANTRAHADSKTGIKGVSRRSDTGKYQARIRVRGKQIHLGCFESLAEAGAIYRAAALHHHGEFARFD